ncbi:YchJ family protein [Salinicola aestuarinus]|uniref:YchJ family protein n=1 Tax=Salinicola aestuarinus TaxID=1949082 RepID=UPI001FDAC1D7|nr:YchJ family protein [Salinicola aestuarinus]
MLHTQDPTVDAAHADTGVCPCGSGRVYRDCCRRLHQGEAIATAPEELMRSRYSAFALGGLGDYLLDTWAPRTRPALTAEALDVRDSQWLGLEIVATQTEANRGTVEFKAYYRPILDPAAAIQVLHERSRFRCQGGVWRYLDGVIDPPPTPVSRNAPCACGSGKKAKRCCQA